MKVAFKDTKNALTKTDLLVLFVTEKERPSLPAGADWAGAPKDFEGGFRKLRWCDGTTASPKRILLVGLGASKSLNSERLRRVAAVAAKTAEAAGVGSTTFWCSGKVATVMDPKECGEALAEGAVMGSYRYTEFKSESKPASLKTLTICGPGAAFASGGRDGAALAEANCFTRDLQNAPGNKMRPRDLASQAQGLAKRSTKITCRVFDEAAMKKMKMEALLGVSAGSSEPARLIHLTYKPTKKAKRKIALVGKGLTFDAGGVSLKPASKMWDMKYDMSGGAAVLGVFHALAKLDVPVEVHGIVPSSENLMDALAQKPGDIVTSMSGQTIEVLNTDAEGRLILCDALTYTDTKVKPDTIIDLATLTGAVVVALGHEMSGMFTDSDKLRADLDAAGKDVSELVWPLPLMDFHKDQMKGEVADLRNINMPGHGNGSTSGAAFLSHFVGDREWCHLDIAGAAWGARNRDYVGGAQGTGVGTRLLVRYLQGQK